MEFRSITSIVAATIVLQFYKLLNNGYLINMAIVGMISDNFIYERKPEREIPYPYGSEAASSAHHKK